MTVFYLMRHGEPDWALAAERKLIGHSADLVSLTETGLREVAARIPEIASFGVDCIISSPMTRALQTGHSISLALQLPLSVEFDLHEWIPDLSCTWSDASQVGALYRDYEQCRGEPPAGTEKPWETRSSVYERTLNVLKRYLHVEKVLVTCHCIVIDALTDEIMEHAGIIPYVLE